jgi:hypothetical protein
MPHRLMHCPNLPLDVGEKIELQHDEHFGVLLEEFEIANALRRVHAAKMYEKLRFDSSSSTQLRRHAPWLPCERPLAEEVAMAQSRHRRQFA